MSQDLIKAMFEIDEDRILSLIEDQLKIRDPLDIINDLKEGLAEVGLRFEKEEYFLSDLVFAADIFKEIMQKMEPHFPKTKGDVKGTILMGTVEGDFHDIGKNIMADLLRFNGYIVEDLGVDVPPEAFLEAVQKNHPDLLGLTGLLTAAFEPMKKTIALIRDKYKKDIIIAVGGAPINDAWITQVGADFGTNNASLGIKLINDAISNKRQAPKPQTS
ncbi:MAG: cobalamin B12-binding domain-containing protein [Candidatus Helarchaeota archaeon]